VTKNKRLKVFKGYSFTTFIFSGKAF